MAPTSHGSKMPEKIVYLAEFKSFIFLKTNLPHEPGKKNPADKS
jgi:hypothetical protein